MARAGRDVDFLSARGQTLVQKAILLWRSGRVDDSLEAGAEAVAIFRRLGLKGHEAHALSSLGVALAHKGSFEDAIAMMRASILLDREIGDRLHLGRKVSNVGQLYAELGDVDNAIGFLQRALDVFELVDDQSGQSDTLCAMAELLAEQVGDLEAAHGVLSDARSLAERIQDPYDLAHVGLVEAGLWIHRDEPRRAERLAKEAASHARAAGARGYELLAMAARSDALSRLDELDEARRVATDVLRNARDRSDVERAERVYYQVAVALARCSEPREAERALANARAVVDARLEHIRDPRLRTLYVESKWVKSIRRDLPIA